MRSLAYGQFTHREVDAQLLSTNPKFGLRFDVLDKKLNVVGELTTVTSCQVEHNIDRDHMGALTLTLDSDDALRSVMLRRLIRPWLQLRMPNHQWVEYPMGAYIWVDPERVLPSVRQEEWKVTLADQTWRLDYLAPDEAGFRVRRGQRITDVIRDIHRSIGYTDLSGIADADDTFAEDKYYVLLTPRTPAYQQRKDLQQQADTAWREMNDAELDAQKRQLAAKTYRTASAGLMRLNDTAPPTDESPVTWLNLLAQFQAGIGYSAPYFDWNGRPMAQPARDLASDDPDHHYGTDFLSIVENLSITPDHSAIANRVTVIADNADGLYGMRTADANTLFPNHPLAQRTVGDYVSAPPIKDPVASTLDALQLRANKELGERLAKHRNMAGTYGLHPAHEPYDLVGQQWTDDADLDVEQTFTQRNVTFDFDSASMTLDMGLVVR